jgi:hypothetical protein
MNNVIPLHETLEVIPDPFHVPYAEPNRHGVVQYFRPKEPELYTIKNTPSTTTVCRDYSASDHAFDAEADALQAIIRLRAACEQMISVTPLRSRELAIFVEFAKQRLNVIATAMPLVRP